MKFSKVCTIFFETEYFGPKINRSKEKPSPSPENHNFSRLKVCSSLGHLINKCKSVSDCKQKGQPSPKFGSRCARCRSVATAPCIILHCKSAARLSIGRLYRDLQQPAGEDCWPKTPAHLDVLNPVRERAYSSHLHTGMIL